MVNVFDGTISSSHENVLADESGDMSQCQDLHEICMSCLALLFEVKAQGCSDRFCLWALGVDENVYPDARLLLSRCPSLAD